MIIEYILNKIKTEDNKEDFIAGLVVGLIFGLGVGLVVGFIFGLVVGFIFGFIFGLVVGLIYGLIFGLGYFLNFFAFLGLVSLITHYPSFLPIWALIGIGIVLTEVFFWPDKSKPKKNQSKFWFTALKKGESLLEATAVLGYLNLARLAIQKIFQFTSWDVLLKWVGYIGAGIIGLGILTGIIFLYIKLNSLKYKKR